MLSASMTQKRLALANLVKTTLDAHGYRTFTVEEEMPRAVLKAESDADRATAMNRPIAYARVQHEGWAAPDDQHFNLAHAVVQTPDRFGVRVWYELDITTDAAYTADQAEWDALTDSTASGSEGILVKLRQAGYIEAGGENVYRGVPEEVLKDYNPLGNGLWVAYLEFAITIT